MVNAGELNEKEVGEVLGISKKTIADLLSLLNMSNRTQELIVSKRISYPFLIRINRLLNKVEDDNLRPKVEKAMIERTLNGTIKRISQVDDFTSAIKKKGDVIAKKIVSSPNYTSFQAMKETGADDIKTANQIKNGINWTVTIINKAIKNRAWEKLDNNGQTAVKNLRTKLDQFIK